MPISLSGSSHSDLALRDSSCLSSTTSSMTNTTLSSPPPSPQYSRSHTTTTTSSSCGSANSVNSYGQNNNEQQSTQSNGIGDSNRQQTQQQQPTSRPRTAEKPERRTVKDFRFGKRIGEGSFSTVYLVEDIHLRKEFASKFKTFNFNQTNFFFLLSRPHSHLPSDQRMNVYTNEERKKKRKTKMRL